MIQQIGLFPHRTIAQNIATVPGLLGWDARAHRGARRRAARADRARPPTSPTATRRSSPGGQQQRVGVARALAADPPVMLMDEPFGAIDPINRERLQNEFLRLQAEIRKTILFVTHDIDEAIKMGDRIAILREGGHLAQYATPAELLMAPADDFVEDFVGADRALKRLALMRVCDIDLWEAPLAFVGQATGEVRAKLEGAEVPHALLVDSERKPLGWLSDTDLAQETVPRAARQLAPTRSSTATTSCATPSPTCSRRRASTRRWSTASGRIDGVLSVEIISDFLSSPEAKVEEHAAAERPLAEAMLADVAARWPRSRSASGSGATTCVGENEGFCFDCAVDNIDRYVDPTLEHLRARRGLRGRPGFADRLGARRPLPPPPLAGARLHRRHRHPLHDPQHRLLRAAAADHGPRAR